MQRLNSAMLKFFNYDIVFQEVPGEVSLSINISNCPNRCKGCHSSYLQEDIGTELSTDVLSTLIDKYASVITCVCFMGGDSDPREVNRLSMFVRQYHSLIVKKTLKVCWFSGLENFSDLCNLQNFNFIKTGPYIENLGGLTKPNTNQRFYKVNSNGFLEDKTHLFRESLPYAKFEE